MREPSVFAAPFVAALLFAALLVGVVGFAIVRSRARRTSSHRKSTAPSAITSISGQAANPSVFVSYSRRDEHLVDRVVNEIEGTGATVWIDRHSGHGSQRYAAPIVAAIKSSRLVALMCSENAFASDHVVREVYVAGDFKKPFIAFQLDESVLPDELLYFLSGFPRIPAEPLDSAAIRTELARILS